MTAARWIRIEESYQNLVTWTAVVQVTVSRSKPKILSWNIMKKETVLFDAVAPYPATIQVGQLLTEIESVIRKHVVLNDQAAAALAVWVLHTYTFEFRDAVAYGTVNK